MERTLAGPRLFASPGPRLRRGLRGVVGVLAVLALWQASVPIVGLSSYFYPAPLDVARAFAELLQKGILPAYLADSLARYAAGVACGTAIGLSLGLGIGLSRTASRLLGPMLNFFYAIVEVAWIPIFVIWWGYGFKVIVVALAYVVAFPMLFNTSAAVRAVPPVLINAVRSLGGSWAQVLREVVLPAALPGLITGFRVGAGFAFRGLIFAEMIAAKTGIGYLIINSAANHATDRTVVGMIIMGALWLLLDRMYLRPFERITVERWGTVNVAEDQS